MCLLYSWLLFLVQPQYKVFLRNVKIIFIIALYCTEGANLILNFFKKILDKCESMSYNISEQTTTHTNPAKTMTKVYNITTRGSEITTESDLDTFKKVFAQRGAKNINIFNSRINPENKQIRFELNGHDFSATAELIK